MPNEVDRSKLMAAPPERASYVEIDCPHWLADPAFVVFIAEANKQAHPVTYLST